MTNTYNQTILYDLPLPPFVHSFKNSFIHTIMPQLDFIITDLQNKQANNNSIVILLTLLLLVFILKQVCNNMFIAKPKIHKIVSQVQVDEEIRGLGCQIKKLKNSLKKIINQATKDNHNEANNEVKQTIQNVSQINNGGSFIDIQQANKLMKYFRQSAEEYNSLAQYILDSQQKICVQLKNVKKLKGKSEKTLTPTHTNKDQIKLEAPKQIAQTISDQPQIKPIYEDKKANPIIQQQNQQAAGIALKFGVIPKPRNLAPPPRITGGRNRVVPPPPIPK